MVRTSVDELSMRSNGNVMDPGGPFTHQATKVYEERSGDRFLVKLQSKDATVDLGGPRLVKHPNTCQPPRSLVLLHGTMHEEQGTPAIGILGPHASSSVNGRSMGAAKKPTPTRIAAKQKDRADVLIQK